MVWKPIDGTLLRRKRFGLAKGAVAAFIGVATALLWNNANAGGQPNDNRRAPANRQIVHVLNRITFGPRPGNIDRVRAIGVEAFIEEQLHPERIDDTRVERFLSGLETRELDTTTVVLRYHLPSLMERRENRHEAASSASQETPGPARGAMPRRQQDLSPAIRRGQLPFQELITEKLVRAVSSERQLQEILVDFWFNHFNVSARKSPLIQPFLPEYERDVIRPRVLGTFRNLLGAVAASPAMLIYLDNWLSSDPAASEVAGRRFERRPPNRRSPRVGINDPRRLFRARVGRRVQPDPRDGLNENYARELLELHTLGADGGFSQGDVIEVARAFSGWTIAPMGQGGGFHFSPELHVDGDKLVLGETIDAGGRTDGERVLDILAMHPSTARLVATKLASRFVADDPPESLVERAASRFLETGGNLREVTRIVLSSPKVPTASR